MNRMVTLATMQQEFAEAVTGCEVNGWEFSEIKEETQQFTVRMVSPIDQEIYIIEFHFDDYPEKPFMIEFLHPSNGQRGTSVCYPRGYDSFFQPTGSICHPCCRKAYAGYTGLHADWQMAGWQQIAGSLTRLLPILEAIFTRISNKSTYNGRMA